MFYGPTPPTLPTPKFDARYSRTHATHTTRPTTLFSRLLQHRCFPVNFVNYSRVLILWSIYERLVLKQVESLTAWMLLTLLEKDFSKGIFRKGFCKKSPSNHFSHAAASFSFVQISEFYSLKLIFMVEQW